jgi:hypothetical protein
VRIGVRTERRIAQFLMGNCALKSAALTGKLTNARLLSGHNPLTSGAAFVQSPRAKRNAI